jgi:uncharacterized iron-regulated protein
MKKIIVLLFTVIGLFAFKSDKPAYQIFNEKGKIVGYDKLVEKAADADVVFFGEMHNNPICHWLQLSLTEDLYVESKGNIILGAEMFETDDQLILNEYLEGKISNSNFEKEAKLWPNYKTDYSPLVAFSKDSNLVFVATNVPRRYASMVYKNGFESLEELEPEAKTYIAPLPIEYDAELKGYKDMLKEMEGMGGHSNENLPKAQAVKDATMAYSIAGAVEEGKIFIHYNGTYHSDNFEGIIWYLNKYKPGLKIVTISSVEQKNIAELDSININKADFILAVPDNMTKTN